MKKILLTTILLYLIMGCKTETKKQDHQEIGFEDFFVKSTDGVQVFVREFQTGAQEQISEYPLVLIHGGGPGAIASFDLDVPNGSFAKDLAKKGIKVYLMNIRGWEKSTLPTYNLSDSTIVVGNYEEATQDIGSVIEFIREKDKVEKVSLFGWATGGHWGGSYAAQNSHKLAGFISLNSLYGTDAPWELKHFFWQESDSTKFNKTGFFRTSDKEGLVRKWTSTIPIENKQNWRDSLIMEAYRSTAVSFGEDKTTMKVPGGYREESFYMSNGRKYWDASSITCPTLILRTDLDFWSRPQDLVAIEKDLKSTERKRIKTIKGTHYVFLDRDERGRKELIDEMVHFLKEQ